MASYSKWDGGPGGLADVNPVRIPPLVGRREYISAAVEALRGGTTGAVLLVAEAGLGKSVLVEAIASALSSEMIVMRVHGTASLASVPYGVLAPYLVDLPEDPTNSQVAILRAFWAQFERLRAGRDLPLLLVVDDAHELDPATANVIVDLITANWAKVVASSRPRPGLPEAMMQLWYDSMAERFDLEPLSKADVGDIAEHALGGPVVPSTVHMLWKASEGNPMLLNCLMEDARREGSLAKKDGVWLLLRPLTSSGPALTGVVRNQLLRRTPQERETLTMIALAEPVRLDALEAAAGPDIVQDLVESQWVELEDDGQPTLRLRHPVYGEAIRNMVSASRSLQLRQRLITHVEKQPESAPSVLRMVRWALESGVGVPDGQLLKAAVHAATTFQNDTAIGLAARIRDSGLRLRGRTAAARAHFNAGQYLEAARSLEAGLPARSEPEPRIGDTLLRASIKNALGGVRTFEPQLDQDVDGSLGEAGPARESRADAVESLLAMEAAGDFDGLSQALDLLEPQPAGSTDPEGGAYLDIVLKCLTADVLRAGGDPVAAMAPADKALESLAEDPAELFFFREFVIYRQATSALDAGEWHRTEEILDGYEDSAGTGLMTFGGTLAFLRGLSLLRQGSFDAAWASVRPAVEALRANDPQQLLAAAVGLAAYAGIRCGQGKLAQAFLEEAEGMGGHTGGPDASLAAIFAAAAREALAKDGSGLERLEEMLAQPLAAGAELQALVALADLGRGDAVPRMLERTAGMTGRWAKSWHHVATARGSDDAAVALEAGEAIQRLGMARLARDCFAQAATLFEAAGDRPSARQANARKDQCERELGEQPGAPPMPAPTPAVLLTRRERDIIALAVEGLTDRQIADRLMVSVRTVEGHLYRSYAKLGIRRREELHGASGI